MGELKPPKKKFELVIFAKGHTKEDVISVIEDFLTRIVAEDSVKCISGDGHFDLVTNLDFLPPEEYEKALQKWHKNYKAKKK